MTTHSDMVYALGGIPAVGGGQIPLSTGSYFFVDSGTGNDGFTGDSIAAPLATIDAAVGKCTADAGDVIIVFPGHAETIAAATTLVIDVDGISIIGLGRGRNRPTLSFSATASRIPISGDDVLVDNFVLLGAVADIVSGVTVSGDDVTLRNIEMQSGSAVLEFLQFIDVDDGDRVTLENCKILAHTTAGTNTGLRFDVAHYLTVKNCEFRGDFTTAAISGTAGTAAASTDILISGCLIENRDTTAGTVIDVHDSGTGLISDNRCFTLFATAPETALDSGDCLVCETYVVNAVDESGTIVPVTLST